LTIRYGVNTNDILKRTSGLTMKAIDHMEREVTELKAGPFEKR
jgi:hypothetical protein